MSERHEFDEEFSAHWYAIVNCEGQDDSFEDGIVAAYPTRDAADAELARRQDLISDDDGWLSDSYVVLPIHVDGIGWNSHDPPPDGWPNKETT